MKQEQTLKNPQGKGQSAGERFVKQVSFKDFFEKSKKEPALQRLVAECFRSSIMTGVTAKKLRPEGREVDCGFVALDALAFLAKR